MKNILITIIICLFFLNVSGQNKTRMATDNFEIIITSRYFGRKDKIITVNSDKVTFEKNVAVRMQNYSKGDSAVSPDLKQEIITFFTENLLEDFKDSYYNKKVKDGIVISFVLKFNNKKKKISVSNYYIKELGELVQILNENVPEDYEIYYESNCCESHDKM